MFNPVCSLSKPLKKAIRIALVCVTIPLSAVACLGQQQPALAGDYVGTLGSIHLKLHIESNQEKLTGTMDSPDQGSAGIPCSDFHLDGQTLSFAIPVVHGIWKGTVNPDGKRLTGTWNQGQPMPLDFTRDQFQAAQKPSAVDGVWLGTLTTGSASLRIQIHVKSDVAGHEYCSLDSLDQQAMGLDCANVEFSASNFSFDVPLVKGHWEGKLSGDGKSLNGVWTQGQPLELNFSRQQQAISPPAPPVAKFDPVMPPVAVAELKAVLDKDFAESLKSGQLSSSTGAGVTIGIVQHGIRRVFSYGTAGPDSIFEIGSITKTFTGLILAQLVEQHAVNLDDPVRALLPTGTVAKPNGTEITLADLATQHSGLPRLPANLNPRDKGNPYADYTAANLYAFLAERGVAKPADAEFLYSNLGFGLLGHALAVHEKSTYAALLEREVTAPLGLRDTVIALSAEQQKRFIQGHDQNHRPTEPWDLGALEGAGAIRSTAGDMLTYLEANLHPEAVKLSAQSGAALTLSTALKLEHQLRADAFGGMKIGLAWLWEPEFKSYWHNGGTGGFTSFAFFMPDHDIACVVLFNITLGPNGSFADRIGEHIRERLLGKPAVSLME